MKSYSEEKRIRPNILTGAVYLAVILMMIYWIISIRIYGDKGAFFTSGPFFLYGFFYTAFVLAVQKAVYIMVRLRARRSQYQNAQANMLRSMKVFGVGGLIAGALLIALSYSISGFVLGSERGFIQLMMAGASILFLGIQGVLRGYLQGIGYTKPIMISDLLIAVTSLIPGIVMVIIFFNYGLKVNGLLHADEFSAVYGSAGMMIGVLIGSVVGFIQILISFRLRKNEINEFIKSGAPRYLDNTNDVISGIRPIMPLYATPALVVLFDQCFYCILTRNIHEDVDYITNYGIYAGRIVCTIALFTMICCIRYIKPLNRVMARIERDEIEGARDRYRYLIRFSNMLFIPVSVFVFAVGETVQIALYGKSSDLANTLMSVAGLMIVFCGHAVMISWLLNHMGKSVVVLVNLGIGWGVHILSLVLLVWLANLGPMGLLLAGILSVVVYDISSFFMTCKMLKFTPELTKSFLLPTVSSLIAGLVAFLVNKLFINLIGEILTLIICVALFWAIYMVVMVVSGGILARELKRVPFGNLFYTLSLSIRRDRFEEG